jgi:glucosyl-dolichyl phosphate glucuronosyltransferase
MKMDIIICTYNNADLLERLLFTLTKQQFSISCSWEVLVVDNNCTDHTAKVVNDYIQDQTIPGLRRIVETKQGLTNARLCGSNNTSSEWIAFVDDDCLLAANWVEQAIQFAASHPQCGAFGGKVILEWETPPSPTLVAHARSFAASDRGETAHQLSLQNFHIPGAGLVMQRKALQQSGWLKKQLLSDREGKELSSGGDSEIVLRILNAGYELWYTPNCVLHHFIPAKRISETYLIKMTYGLGTAAPYIAILRWNHSYGNWLITSIFRVIKYLLVILGYAILAIWKTSMRTEVQIEWSWTKGQIDSLLILQAMPKEERSIWLNVFE